MLISNDNSNINYTNLNTLSASYVVPVRGGKNHILSQANVGSEEGDPITTIINAAEIDWNGADVGDRIINTTGELLEWVKNNSNGGSSNIDTYDKETIDNIIGELSESKVDKENVYNKNEITNIVNNINNEIQNTIDNLSQSINQQQNTYDKETIDNIVGELSESKVDKENVYNKNEITNIINNVSNDFQNSINNLSQSINQQTNTYDKETIDNLIGELSESITDIRNEFAYKINELIELINSNN